MDGSIADAALLVNARIGLNFLCSIGILAADFAYLNDSYALHEPFVRAQQVLGGLRIEVDDADGVGEAQRRRRRVTTANSDHLLSGKHVVVSDALLHEANRDHQAAVLKHGRVSFGEKMPRIALGIRFSIFL